MAIDNYDLTGIYMAAVQRNNAGTVAETEIPIVNSAELAIATKEIKFEGSGTSYNYIVMEGLSVEINTESAIFGTLKTIFGKTEVTADIPVAEAVRLYFGDQSDAEGATGGLALYCTAVRRDTNAKVNIKIVAPLGQFSPVNSLGLKTRDKGPMKLVFNAKKTSVDAAGDALPGVPTGGAFWYVAELAA